MEFECKYQYLFTSLCYELYEFYGTWSCHATYSEPQSKQEQVYKEELYLLAIKQGNSTGKYFTLALIFIISIKVRLLTAQSRNMH